MTQILRASCGFVSYSCAFLFTSAVEQQVCKRWYCYGRDVCPSHSGIVSKRRNPVPGFLYRRRAEHSSIRKCPLHPKIRRGQFSTTPLSFDALYAAKPNEYRHNPYIPTNQRICATFPPLVVQVYLHSNFSDGTERQAHNVTECIIALQGHPRSSILVPIESACTYSYQWSIATWTLSCTVSEIRRLKCRKTTILTMYPAPIPA